MEEIHNNMIVPSESDIEIFLLEGDWPVAHETKFIDVKAIKCTDIEQLWIDLIPVQWAELFNIYEEEIRAAGGTINRLVQRRNQRIVPEPWNIYRAYTITPWVSVKVVIIGQDPYYLTEGGIPSATGCCFECAPGMPIRQSLQTIFLRLAATVDGFRMPENGDLTKWATQGVLLINAALTTNENEANAHAEIWKFFSIRVMQFLAEKKRNVVYMLWGKFAQSLKTYINTNENLVLEASHPAARGNLNTFRKCDHFNEANTYLETKGRGRINWHL